MTPSFTVSEPTGAPSWVEAMLSSVWYMYAATLRMFGAPRNMNPAAMPPPGVRSVSPITTSVIRE